MIKPNNIKLKLKNRAKAGKEVDTEVFQNITQEDASAAEDSVEPEKTDAGASLASETAIAKIL